MDNLKPIGKTEEELHKQMQAVRNFRVDIHMEFRIAAKFVLKRGKLVHSQNLTLGYNRET